MIDHGRGWLRLRYFSVELHPGSLPGRRWRSRRRAGRLRWRTGWRYRGPSAAMGAIAWVWRRLPFGLVRAPILNGPPARGRDARLQGLTESPTAVGTYALDGHVGRPLLAAESRSRETARGQFQLEPWM